MSRKVFPKLFGKSYCSKCKNLGKLIFKAKFRKDVIVCKNVCLKGYEPEVKEEGWEKGLDSYDFPDYHIDRIEKPLLPRPCCKNFEAKEEYAIKQKPKEKFKGKPIVSKEES